MPPETPAPKPPRPAAVINQQIRALWQHADGTLNTEQKKQYETLVCEWAAAVQAAAGAA